MEFIRHGLTKLGFFAANPLAFLAVALYGAMWLVASPSTFEWHAVSTVATFIMTLLIQCATLEIHKPPMPSSTSCSMPTKRPATR